MPQEHLIAIGDIHGCSKALSTLLDTIQPTQLDTIVTLGDYIDRGPDSRGVIEQLLALPDRCTLIPIFGNHEEMLFNATKSASEMRFWLDFGGRATLDSYGIQDEVGRIAEDHIRFLQNCKDCYETGSHFFAHGYYEPGILLEDQPWNELRWVRIPYYSVAHCSGKTAVVGHTPQRSGEILDLGFLKGIDTDCCHRGWLTALEIESGRIWQTNEKGEVRE